MSSARESRKRKEISYAESAPSNETLSDDESEVSAVAEEDEVDEGMSVDDVDDDDLAESGDDVPKKSKSKSTSKNEKGGKSSSKTVTKSQGTSKKSSSTAAKSTDKKKSALKTSTNNTKPSKNTTTVSSSSATALPAIPTPSGTINPLSEFNGPPITTDAAAKKLITQYMRSQNRPYSVQQIFDNLHKRIPKATLERVLTALSAPSEGLFCKEYGKAKIYYVDQSFLPSEKSAAEIEELQEQVTATQSQWKALLEQEKQFKNDLTTLQNEPEDNELDR
jgi:hypothetical protein